ncbi:MAG: type IV pilus assembly protein PilM [Acidobacteriia bacterium]|nr:type IV pilus assembly protein PilM [Terriglobia bacterium]
MFGLGDKSVVGLDIGSSSVKVCELKKTRHGMLLTAGGIEPLAPDTVVDGAIMDANNVSEAIERLYQVNRIKNQRVATSVSGHSVICKKISVAPMSEQELAESIQWEAEQHVPFDISDVNLDYQVLKSSNPTAMDILLVAVKKDKIWNHTQAVIQAGKTPAVVDFDAFAVQNAYENSYGPAPSVCVGLLNLGASVLNINVVKNGESLFTRDVSIGGNQYTDAFQKELNLSFEEAEKIKLGKNVSGVDEETRRQLIQSVSEILLLEVRKTFDFFRSSPAGETIQRAYLSGGGARVEGLLNYLQQKLGIPVELLDPFRKIEWDSTRLNGTLLKENAPSMSVVMGLALRSFD